MDTLTALEKINFWESIPENFGYERTEYLEFLESASKSNLILVLTGQRRVGKSYILRQFINHLIKNKKIQKKNILYINLEFFDFYSIKSAKDLSELIEEYFKKIKPNINKEVYILIDEVQEVSGWEKLLSSYLSSHKRKIKVIITGSNSNLLSSELATYITGRYIAKEVYPFSYKNFLGFYDLKNSKEQFELFLKKSHLPEPFILNNDDLVKIYLNDLKDSILFKDIIKRYKVQNIDLLEKLFLFLVDNIGNLFSINSILKKIKSEGYSTNINTISSYLKYFQQAYLIHAVDRYDIKGKKIIEGEKKYYLNDIGFKTYLFSNYDLAYGKILENYIYNYLIQSGYKVYIGKTNTLEVDFIAEKANEKKYIQVTYLLYDEKILKRELLSLETINDNWEKLIVSLDSIKFKPKSGIKHIQAWDLEGYL